MILAEFGGFMALTAAELKAIRQDEY